MPIVFVPVGALVGWVYFAVMRHSLTSLGKKSGVLIFIALVLVRVVLFGGGAVAALLVGGWCIIGYALGFVVARTIAVSKARGVGSREAASNSPDTGDQHA